MSIVLSLLVCLAGQCQWQTSPETYASPIGCLAAAQQVAADYQRHNPGHVTRTRCGRAEGRA